VGRQVGSHPAGATKRHAVGTANQIHFVQSLREIGALGLKDRIELGAQFGRKGDIDGIALEPRADIEHIGKCAPGNDEMLRLIASASYGKAKPTLYG
jgi:hypothetical protein